MADVRFHTTRWTLVLAAGRGHEAAARDALAFLCAAYWYPLYAYVRARGYAADEARDLTQAFFTRLLEKEFMRQVSPERGRFRSFLLAAMRHFLSNEWDRSNARKRGGDIVLVPLDGDAAEERFRRDPVDRGTPEKLFERQWALDVLDRALRRLGKQRRADALQFAALRHVLLERGAQPYREIAAELGTTEGAARVAVHRLRQRFRELVREEIAATVSTPEAVNEELRFLMAALQG